MTKKEAFEKYLHLYLGSKAKVKSFIDTCTLTGVSYNSNNTVSISQPKSFHVVKIDNLTLYLRPLSSMTDAEALECAIISEKKADEAKYRDFDNSIVYRSTEDNGYWTLFLGPKLTPKQFTWFLENGFDLFGLIEQGHAKTLA